jgi:hypothetical protein
VIPLDYERPHRRLPVPFDFADVAVWILFAVIILALVLAFLGMAIT